MPNEIPSDALTVDMQALDDNMDQWALSMGRFLVAFTACEYWTFMFVRTFGSENLRESITELQLKPRIAIAQALIRDICLTDEPQMRVNRAFGNLTRLAKQRNLVAHNTPLIHLYKDEQGTIFVRHELRGSRDKSKQITIENLAALAAESHALNDEFALIYGLVRQPENHRTR